MTTAYASPLIRLITPIIKPTFALFAALAIGSAWADITWTGQGGDSNWETAENWSAYDTTTGMTLDHSGVSGAYEIDISSNPTRAGYIWVAANNGVTLKASGTYGLNQTAGDIRVGTWNNGKLTIDGGTHAINSLVVASGWWNNFAPTGELNVKGGAVVTAGWNALGDTDSDTTKSTHNPNSAGTLNVENATLSFTSDFLVGRLAYGTLNVNNGAIVTCQGGDSSARWTIVGEQATGNGTINLNYGGVLAVWHIQKGGGSATVNFNGGTLKTLGNTGNCEYIIGNDGAPATGPTVNISANGGVFDSNGLDTKVGVAVTGAGTLIKRGSGALTLSGDLTGFTGKLQVREGSVVIPSASTSIAPGASTIKTVVGETTVFTPLVVTALNLDFEDSDTYSSGWSLSGNGEHGQENRTLADSSTSNFLRIQTGTGSGDRRYTASYSLPAILASASGYTLEFDWFAAQNAIYGETSLDMGLYVYAGNDVKVRIVSNPVTNGGNYARIYLNGSSVAETTTLATASARNYSNESESSTSGCTGTANQDKWYHVILRANSNDGLTLQILKNDLQTVVFEETKVCDFINLTRVYLDMNKRRSNFPAYSGFDDILATIPASAMFDGVGYLSVQDAIDAAAASARETKTVLLLDDVTEDVTISAAGTILNLGSFSLTGTVSAGSGMVVAYDSVANTWRCSADVSTYTWTNASTDNQWTTIGNWLAGNEVATELPSSDTTVVFPASETPWEVELSGSVAVDELQFYGSTSLSGAVVSANAISGDAAITLMRGAGLGNRGFEMAFSNPIFVPADSTATNVLYASGADLNYSGSLTGSGNLQFRVTAGYGVNYSGVCSEFAGTILVLNTDGNNTSTLSGSALSGSSYAKWVVYNYSNNNNTGAAPNFVDGVGQTVNFGELSGSYQRCRAAMYNGSNVLVIGGLNTDFSLGGQFGTNNGGRYDKIRKVGSGTMTFTGTMAGAYEVNEGVIYLASANSYPSLADSNTYVKFGGGTLKLDAVYTHDISTNISRAASMSSIMIDDGGVNRTWEVALPSTCVGGLTKKGEGSLTLAAVPAYTGPTKVEAGALYVVEGGEWTPTLSATVEVNTDREGYRKFIPLKPSGVMFLIF